MNRKPLLASCSALVFVLACCASAAAVPGPADPLDQPLGFRVVAEYPHDTRHFTQGLIFSDGKLIESTGEYGASAIYETDLKNNQPERRAELDSRFFGEGIAALGNRFFLLSWREQTAFVYDRSFRLLKSLSYEGEGWGITALPSRPGPDRLVISDGSARLRIVNPETFEQLGALLVRDEAGPVAMLNELEFASGEIFANVWMTDRIVAISPETGRVVGSLNLAALRQRFDKPSGWNAAAHVLNGIAFNPANGHFFVTGKCWPKLFEIEVLWPGKGARKSRR